MLSFVYHLYSHILQNNLLLDSNFTITLKLHPEQVMHMDFFQELLLSKLFHLLIKTAYLAFKQLLILLISRVLDEGLNLLKLRDYKHLKNHLTIIYND